MSELSPEFMKGISEFTNPTGFESLHDVGEEPLYLYRQFDATLFVSMSDDSFSNLWKSIGQYMLPDVGTRIWALPTVEDQIVTVPGISRIRPMTGIEPLLECESSAIRTVNPVWVGDYVRVPCEVMDTHGRYSKHHILTIEGIELTDYARSLGSSIMK